MVCHKAFKGAINVQAESVLPWAINPYNKLNKFLIENKIKREDIITIDKICNGSVGEDYLRYYTITLIYWKDD